MTDIETLKYPIGRMPMQDVSIPIGTHEVRAVHPESGERSATVVVRYGEIAEVNLH